ncbi:hypothetical protein MA4S0726RA_3038 [Mycobacteroides abscessus 4S-0726-RA]|nr:hypothetical protein MA4S0726RA_3038 [Mycobacteroides abscessus 4S-0726-RA]
MGGSEEMKDSTSARDVRPPGEVLAVQDEGKGQYGRAYIREAPDFGHSRASLRLGPLEFNAHGKGAAAALAVGIAGSIGVLGVTVYAGLPLVAVMVLCAMPTVLVSLLILIGMLRS